jgi:Protein of unknown function (DUF3644)/EC042_2821-lke REase
MTSPLTAGLLKRPGNPGAKGRLLAKSLEAYVLALETINRLTIAYRLETFCALVCNAWELLLKAKILEDTRDRKSIYYTSASSERRRSLSLRDALKKVFLDERDQKRRNVERVEELRDAAIHLFISEVPKDVLGLLQACVLNYHNCIVEWFGIVLSERIPLGMMSIVFDVSPERLDMSDAVMRRRLGKDSADYLLSLVSDLRTEHASLGGSPEFSVEIRYGLAIEKRAEDAAVVAVSSSAGTAVRIVERSRDPGITHPWRQKELVAELISMVPSGRRITTGDVQAVVAAHDVKHRSEWFYQGSVKGSPGQYSRLFAEWFKAQLERDSDFLAKSRASARHRPAVVTE